MIFQDLARRESTVWLPGDVYPVYLTLAGDAGLRTRLYPTLPEPSFPAGEPGDGIDHLLVANPLKPLGRYLTQAEVAAFTKWLDTSPSRRILVDCVYDLGDRFHDSTRQLQASGRAILLHSVTKGWLWPRTFGVALVPDGEFEASFRAEPPSRDQLCLARWLLSIDATRPGRVAKALQSRARILADRMPGAVRRRLVGDLGGSFPGCYFFPVEMGAEELLEGHEILAIPASAFGSKWPGSILTSLSAAFAVAEDT
jgi:aspartate/methionine/tyrosine aminotransferase